MAVTEVVQNSYEQEIIRRLEKKSDDIELIDLSEHFKDGKVIIDVITLDSASCSPCQYMMEVVIKAAKKFNSMIEYNEHKIKNRSGLQMMATLGVKNIPAICINGKVEFSSRTPKQTELEERIEKYFTE